MPNIDPQDEGEDESTQSDNGERRGGTDRRQKSADGFTCISIVGWICRREQCRRIEDSDSFCEDE